jgi:carboxyl-terminal processing protease
MKVKLRRKWVIPVVLVLILAVLASTAWFLFFNKTMKHGDYSTLSWTEAFDKMYQQLSKEYAFTDWKHVDWNNLYDEYAPQIQRAQKDKDFNAYYIALRGFLTEIPDGHVSLNNLKKIDDLYIGGGFGASATKLSDGSVIAAWVDESGPAYASGMRTGAVLTKWNNEPIGDALKHVSTIFGGTSATTENLELKQVQYLTRAPIGTKAKVTFINSGASPKTVTLTAYDDGLLSLKKSYPGAILSDKIRSMYLGVDDPDPVPHSMVETKMLKDNIFYIKIWGELDADLQGTGKAPSTLGLFRQAIDAANAQQAAAVIVDVRNNLGGLDDMTAAILGSFYSKKTLFEYQCMYNEKSGKFELLTAGGGSGTLYIEPAEPHFDGPVLCLINQKCVSCGEGIAMGVKNLPNGETMGFYGTNGSFGLAGAEIAMPGGLTVHYPAGRSLGADHQIQIDSKSGAGGVTPSIRVEMTAERAIRAANGEDVELEEAIRSIQSLNRN